MKEKMEKNVNGGGGGINSLENKRSVEKKENLKSGISLIVLVITILVIIVLAGAVILAVTKNNPLTSANEAVFKSDIKNFETELSVSVATKLGEGIDTSEINADKNSTPNITEYIGSNDKEKVWAEEAGIKVKNQILRICNVNISNVTENSADIEVVLNNESLVRGYKLSLDNGATYGSEQVSKIFNITGLSVERNYSIKVKAVKPDNTELESSSYSFTTTGAASLYGVIVTENRTVNKTTGSYSNPIIPKGFKTVDDIASWANRAVDYDKGLVIEDANGNQFVWIPAGKYGYSAHYGRDGANDMSIDEMEQINKYGGYYVGRFEASNNGGKAASKKNQPSWSTINYTDAKAKAEGFSSVYGTNYTSSWTSGLLTCKMWDTMCKFIASDGTNVTTSSSWGNYIDDPYTGDNGAINTGSREEFKKKNLYDVAGNMWEWTYEINEQYRLIRGGTYALTGSYCPASYLKNGSIPLNSVDYGYRLALYIK